jgi:hypothetical protein
VNALFRDQHEWNRKSRSSNIIVERTNVIIVIVSAMTVVNLPQDADKVAGSLDRSDDGEIGVVGGHDDTAIKDVSSLVHLQQAPRMVDRLATIPNPTSTRQFFFFGSSSLPDTNPFTDLLVFTRSFYGRPPWRKF